MKLLDLHKSFSILLLLNCIFQTLHSQNSASIDIITAIKTNNITSLNAQLNITNIDTLLNSQGLTPLQVAIETNNPLITDLLLKLNTNPNNRYKGLTPLMYASKNGSFKIMKLLLKAGAKVNDFDSSGNTALIMASQKQPPQIIKLLLKYGAFLNARNKEGYTAYDFSIKENNRASSNFLNRYFESHLPNYFDGPYVRYKSKNEIEILYLKHDSLLKKYSRFSSDYNLKSTNFKFKGFIGDTNTYSIPHQFIHEASEYKNIQKLVILGDIHGGCDSLKMLLKANQITDNNFNWNFGNGHLLFLGDIFDRGEQVTESLWLIYKLEQQAEMVGGKVHLLLGNHEIMEMEGDYRYLAYKYYALFKYFHLENKTNYSAKSVIGEWLRSKNTMEKINDILFVHGGIHPELLNYNVQIDSINRTIGQYLNAKRNKDKSKGNLTTFLLSEKGPFWYRGMINNDELAQTDINAILTYYCVNTIMVGHTYLPGIKTFFNNKIFGLDVQFYIHTGVPIQALFINPTGFYILNTNGYTKKLE